MVRNSRIKISVTHFQSTRFQSLKRRLSKRISNNRWLDALKNNDVGNVESALTLIPLMILFLTVAQVGISVYSRSVSDQSTQGAVAYAAMGSNQSSNSGVSTPWSSPLIALPLPGGGSVLVGERVNRTPGVTPLLPGGESFTSTGIAVQE